jgi:hypothetical protein
MANIRDPSFWRRFSLAVHRQEEKEHLQLESRSTSGTGSPASETPPPAYSAAAGVNIVDVRL